MSDLDPDLWGRLFAVHPHSSDIDALAPVVAEVEREAKADALREAADLLIAECSSVSSVKVPCFCGSATWLRERAAMLCAESGER